MEENYLMAQCQQICGIVSCQEGQSKEGIIHEKVNYLIQENIYLTEE